MPPKSVRTTQRAPQSCQRCSTKKMRCSKTIPCEPCIDLGLAQQCRREQVILTKQIRNQQRHRGQGPNTTSSTISPQPPRRQRVENVSDIPTVGDRSTPNQQPSPSAEHHHRARPFIEQSDEGCDCTNAERLDCRTGAELQQEALLLVSPTRNSNWPLPEGLPEASSETSPYNEGADVENAATALEFLAWGRVRDAAVSPLPIQVSIVGRDLLTPQQARLVLSYHRDWLSWTHNTIPWPKFFNECRRYWREGIVGERAWLAVYYATLSVLWHKYVLN